MEWISIKDRVPGAEDAIEDYLVVYEYKDGGPSTIGTCHLSECTQSMYDWHHTFGDPKQRWRRVTHWMRFPLLPDGTRMKFL